MKYEDDRFIIYYNECDKSYINKLIDMIKKRLPRRTAFFKIDYNDKITIKLYDDIEAYKQNITASFARNAKEENEQQQSEVKPREYQEWMIANTEDGNINMLSLPLVLKIAGFENYTEDLFIYNGCHESVHICQQKSGSNSPGWFWEVLATYLGNPECQHKFKGEFTIDDLDNRFDQIDGYGAAFKIANYDLDYILSLTKDTDLLYKTIAEILSVFFTPVQAAIGG